MADLTLQPGACSNLAYLATQTVGWYADLQVESEVHHSFHYALCSIVIWKYNISLM